MEELEGTEGEKDRGTNNVNVTESGHKQVGIQT